MKHSPSRNLVPLLLGGALLAVAAYADTSMPIAVALPPDALPMSESQVEAASLVLTWLLKFPRLTALCALIGAVRIPAKLLFTCLDHRAASDVDNTALDRIVARPIYGLLHLVVDTVASVKLDSLFTSLRQQPAAGLAVALLGAFFLSGCGTPPGMEITSVTQSGFGLRLSPSPSGGVPSAMIGFERLQYHRIPVATNGMYAPALISGIDINTSFTGRNDIGEQFATGLGIAVYDTNRVGLALARARVNAAARAAGTNAALILSETNLVSEALTNAPALLPDTNAPVVLPAAK